MSSSHGGQRTTGIGPSGISGCRAMSHFRKDSEGECLSPHQYHTNRGTVLTVPHLVEKKGEWGCGGAGNTNLSLVLETLARWIVLVVLAHNNFRIIRLGEPRRGLAITAFEITD